MSPPEQRAAEGEKPGNWPSLLEGLLFADTIDLLQELIKLFRHSSPDERRLACWAMGTSISVPILSTRGVATEVGTLLADTHAEVRAAACHTLLEIGDYSVPVLPQLLERLKDPVKSVRCDAVKTVCVVARHAMDEAVSEALAALLRPEERPTTALAAEALGELQAVSAVPELEELLEQARLPEVKRAATVALAKLKGEPRRFAELLEGGQLEDRRAGLKGLLALGEKAEEFAPQVAQRLCEVQVGLFSGGSFEAELALALRLLRAGADLEAADLFGCTPLAILERVTMRSVQPLFGDAAGAPSSSSS